MKMTKKIINGMMLLALSFTASFGQIDEQRMARDLKIAEDILSTLANQDSRVWYNDNIESNYIADYGVIFTIPMRSYVIRSNAKGSVVYSTGSSRAVTIIERGSGDSDGSTDAVVAKTESDKEVEMNEEEISAAMKSAAREQMITFLADYADLISQLNPTDRIVLQTKGRQDLVWGLRSGSQQQSDGVSAQVLKSDITAYKQGKINRETFVGKIDFTEVGEKAERDVELFATIFARLYEPDLSSTYYLATNRIGYTSLKNLGVTFNLKFYSSSSDNGLHTIRTTGESGLTQEERNAKVNAMYADFEKSFKENLLDYGRTIKSLDADEQLIFKVRLTECRGCEMPEEIEVSVKMKTLQDFDKGTLSRSKALEQILIKKQ